MKQRTIALIIVSLIVVSIVASFRGPGKSGTTFSAKPEGSQALFDLFLETGLAPERWFYPYSELDPVEQGTIMFVMAPDAMTGFESVLGWVARGNSLVLFEGNPLATASLRQKLHLVETAPFDSLDQAPPLKSLPSLLKQPEFPSVPFNCPTDSYQICAAVKQLSTRFLQSRYQHLGDSTVLAGSNEAAVALRIPHGNGVIWWFSGPEPALNENLDLHDNITLLYALGKSANRLLFDEFHHGYTAPLIGEAARKTEILYAFLGCLGIWLAVGAASRFIRFGHPTPVILQNSSAGLDFVAVLGLLYEDRNAASLMRKYVQAWRARLTRSLGVGADLPLELLAEECLLKGLADQRDVSRLKLALQELTNATDYSDRDYTNHISVLEQFAKQISGRTPYAQSARNAA